MEPFEKLSSDGRQREVVGQEKNNKRRERRSPQEEMVTSHGWTAIAGQSVGGAGWAYVGDVSASTSIIAGSASGSGLEPESGKRDRDRGRDRDRDGHEEGHRDDRQHKSVTIPISSPLAAAQSKSPSSSPSSTAALIQVTANSPHQPASAPASMSSVKAAPTQSSPTPTPTPAKPVPVPTQPQPSVKPVHALREFEADVTIVQAQMGTTAEPGPSTGDMQTDAAGTNTNTLSTESSSTASTLSDSLLSSSTSVWHNTWITSTTIEPAGSLTLEPFPTFGNTAQAPFSSAPSGGTAIGANAIVDSSFSEIADSIAAPGALPGITGRRGVNATAIQSDPDPEDTGKAFAVAGITAASIIVAVLVLLAIATYIRSGVSWKPGVNCLVKRKAQVSASDSEPASLRQAFKGFFRWRNRDIRHRDLETASASSGAGARCDGQKGEVDEGMWEEIDISDPRSGYMEKDNGEWLESWRRQRESMMSNIRRAPELRFGNDLSLPGLSLETPCPR